MTNFDFLKQDPKFNSFSNVAIAAEKIIKIDKESSVINCRRAMEFAIKWMYSVDDYLETPYQDNLISLMSTEDFHDLVDDDLWKRLDLIRKLGNRAAHGSHNGRKITEDEAVLCLQNLFIFMDFVSYCYSDFYEERVANIPEIQMQSELINKILHTNYINDAGIDEFEHIRVSLRNLMKYLPKPSIRYDTDFTDEILSIEWNGAEIENDELKNYKAKAEFYVRGNQDNIAIAKLWTNQPLTNIDIENFEQILWKEVGSKEEYEKEYGHKPLGEFVREIVGLDMNAAKEALFESHPSPYSCTKPGIPI